MKKIFLLASLTLLLTSCGGGKIDLNNDEQVMEKLNTTERDGKFVFVTIVEGAEIKKKITIKGNVLNNQTYMNGRSSIDFDYEFTLGPVTENGRELTMERCYGVYYYTADDKIIRIVDEGTIKYDFIENRN
jgi:hypothetical protein